MTSLTFKHTIRPGSGRLLLVGANVESATYWVESVTFAGQPMAPSASPVEVDTSDDCYASIYYLADPPEGSGDIVATLSSTSARRMAAWAISFRGVDTASPIGGHRQRVEASTKVTSASLDFTSAEGELVVDSLCLAGPSAGKVSAAPGQTEHVNVESIPASNLVLAASSAPGSPLRARCPGPSPAPSLLFRA